MIDLVQTATGLVGKRLCSTVSAPFGIEGALHEVLMEVDETAVARQLRGAEPGTLGRIITQYVTALTSWASPEW